MLLETHRRELIAYGQKLVEANLTKGTGGNLSICHREEGIMAITPSGIDYFDIKPEQIVIMDVETGKILEGDAVPSSESDMHRILYKYRNDLNAVIHTHTTYATTLACLNIDLPAVHYLVALAGPDVRCAAYATYGTVELAKNAFEAMKDRKSCLLSNHGLLAGGPDLAAAFTITEEIEFCCELYYRAKSIGEPVILSEKEMALMMDRFKNYGKRREEHDEI